MHPESDSVNTMPMAVANAGEAPQREQLYHEIAAAQARVTAATQRRSLALKDLNRAKQELERLRSLAKGSKATKQRLAEAAAAEADWLARPGAAGTLGMIAGPLSKQVGRAAAWCSDKTAATAAA
jgi:multidrug resistance efflux pump